MPSTAYYLQQAVTAVLESIWDPSAQLAAPYYFEDISPLPPKDTPSEDLIGHVWKKPVDDLLQAQDLPAQASDDAHGHDFVANSATILQIEHSRECPGVCRVRHSDALSAGNAPGFIEYQVQWQYSPYGWDWGTGGRMPDHIPEVLRRALLMQNLCEWSIVALWNLVDAFVRKIDPGATSLWMAVVPRRRFQLLFNGAPPASTHSVLLIRSPLAGNFVLDPTGEQYGIPREHRFLPWRTYKKRYIMSPSKWMGEAVWSTRTEAYLAGLNSMHEDWRFWARLRDAMDAQVAAWLPHGDLKAAIDDEDRWKQDGERLLQMVQEVFKDQFAHLR